MISKSLTGYSHHTKKFVDYKDLENIDINKLKLDWKICKHYYSEILNFKINNLEIYLLLEELYFRNIVDENLEMKIIDSMIDSIDKSIEKKIASSNPYFNQLIQYFKQIQTDLQIIKTRFL